MKKENIKITGNERASNIELLRIVTILFVVFSHFCVHSRFSFTTETLSLNQLLVQFGGIGEIGVSVFVIITGFYSVNRKNNAKKAVTILMEVWLYNVLILLFTLLSKERIDIEIVLKHIVPIYNTHWFVYAYVFLCALMPFINKFLVNIDKTCYQKLMAVLLVSWGVVYTFTGADLNYSYLVWFVFLYMLGAYVKIYGKETPDMARNGFFLLICMSLMMGSTIIINLLGLKYGFYPRHGNHFYSLHSPFVLGSALSLFQLFRGFKIKQNRLINTIAGTTLAIYLISDSALVRSWLWNDLFKNVLYSDSRYLLLVGIIEVLVICSICSILDIGRKKIFETKPLVKLTQAICNVAERTFSLLVSKIWKWGQTLL